METKPRPSRVARPSLSPSHAMRPPATSSRYIMRKKCASTNWMLVVTGWPQKLGGISSGKSKQTPRKKNRSKCLFCPFHFKSFQVIFATFLDTLPPVVRKLVNNNFDPSHQQPQPGLGWAILGKPNFTRRCESAENPLTVQDTEVQSLYRPVTVIVSRKLVIITTPCTVTVGCCCSAVKEDPNIIHQLLSTILSTRARA